MLSRILLATSFFSVACSMGVAAQVAVDTRHYVSRRLPVIAPRKELSADRAASLPMGGSMATSPRAAQSSINQWTLLASGQDAIIHDLSFADLRTGFAAGELGAVFKTTDGGATWSIVLDLGFPYEFYGVHALSATQVVVSGFNDSTDEGLLRYSVDGGATWSDDVLLTATGWAGRVRSTDFKHGLVVDITDALGINDVHLTSDGGLTAGDWSQVTPAGNTGWFGDQFSLLADGRAATSGINYCSSVNTGEAWTCGASVDELFDGETFFLDNQHGWVASGTISPTVAGWVHRTADGGQTWSGRTLNSPWPIREILFLTPLVGLAAGGNIYSNVGGIYYTLDGGLTWTQDLDSQGFEMDACDSKPNATGFQVWCAGYNSDYTGKVFTIQVQLSQQ